jgi:hypothetical protein
MLVSQYSPDNTGAQVPGQARQRVMPEEAPPMSVKPTAQVNGLQIWVAQPL